MPANRFDTAQQYAYQSQHVPMPFELISALGAKSQAKQDKALDDTYKLNDLMAQIPAIHDPQLGLSNIKKKQDLDKKYHPRIDALAAKIAAGDPSATRELEQVKRDFVNDPDRQELENSYVNYKAYKEDKTKKGDKYAEYKDAYKGQSLIDEEGNLKPFRFSGMGEIQDHSSEARAQMADIAKWGYDSKNSHLSEDGNIYTRDSHGKYIKDDRVRHLANQKAIDFVKTEKGKDYLDLIKYQNPNATPQEIHKQVSDYLYHAGLNQVFSDVGGGSDVQVTALTTRKLDKEDEKIGRLPMQELPVSTPEDVSNKAALGVFGLDKHVNDKGDFDYNSKLSTGSAKGPGLMNAPIALINSSGNKENTTNLVEFYTGLNNTAKNLGIVIPKDSKGKTDYNKLQEVITTIGKNMLVNGQVGQGLQAELSNNMSGYYLGKMDSKGEEFKTSPFLETAKITETGNSANKVIEEDQKNLIAKNGVIKDINFYAEQPGTFVVTTNDSKGKSKNYDIYLGEKVSKALITPTWSLTKSFDDNIKGAIKPQQQQEFNKNEASLGNDLIKQYQSIQNPKLKAYLIENLQNTLQGSEKMKTTSIVNSAETLPDGSSKYILIGKQEINPQTYQPINKVIVVNRENGNIEFKDLNEVQAQESSFIQNEINVGYKDKLRKGEQ